MFCLAALLLAVGTAAASEADATNRKLLTFCGPAQVLVGHRCVCVDGRKVGIKCRCKDGSFLGSATQKCPDPTCPKYQHYDGVKCVCDQGYKYCKHSKTCAHDCTDSSKAVTLTVTGPSANKCVGHLFYVI